MSGLETERAYLLRYASLQLRDPHAAEDAVQETLVAALAGRAGFEGRSSLRTWLTGILKHKISDAIRRLSCAESSEAAEATVAWPDPDALLEQKRFFAALETCLERLPRKIAQAFMMREHVGLDARQICRQLAITPGHYWVLMHRARLALRAGLEGEWLAK